MTHNLTSSSTCRHPDPLQPTEYVLCAFSRYCDETGLVSPSSEAMPMANQLSAPVYRKAVDELEERGDIERLRPGIRVIRIQTSWADE